MTRTAVKKSILATLLPVLASGMLCAQEIAPDTSIDVIIPNDNTKAAQAGAIIFSNLEPRPDSYDTSTYNAYSVAGFRAQDTTEEWVGVAFIPKVNVRAKELLAAIAYISGVKKVKLGIYTDSSGTVGTLLPGGEGSTTDIPDSGTCCQLAKVILSGSGVALTAGSRYWLVASTDDVDAPTFEGEWRISFLARSAYLIPPSVWSYFPGQWPAAQIRGTRTQESASVRSPNSIAARNVVFSNLGPTGDDLYNAGLGVYVAGDKAADVPEIWVSIPFTAKVDSHAKTLAAAIGYISGTKKVNLGIYSDDGGAVGTALPDGQGSTTDIPTFGVCCELTKVTLPKAGVALTAGSKYWLVASPDNVSAPTFEGLWQESNLAIAAFTFPELGTSWTSFSANWFAAKILGTTP